MRLELLDCAAASVVADEHGLVGGDQWHCDAGPQHGHQQKTCVGFVTEKLQAQTTTNTVSETRI